MAHYMDKIQSPLRSIALVLSLAFFSKGSVAMAGIFGSHTLFSAVTGQVVINGESIANTTVRQMVRRGDGEMLINETQTDSNGFFKFEEVKASKGILDFLPSEMVVQQELKIVHEGTELQGWLYTKRDGIQGSETSGGEFSMICEVNKEADFTDNYFGICSLVKK